TLPSVFERGGVVVFFPESQGLSDRVFLKPSALAERIYEVLKKEVLDLHGEFRLEDIFDKKKADGFRKVFIEATQSLQLVFPHPHPAKKDYYLAPQYFPESYPIEDLFKIASHGAWQSAFWVRVPLFYYKKLLHGLVLHYAADEQTEARHFWKHGIVFLKNGLRVLLKGLYPAEDQHEGILLVGVESSPTNGHLVLQKEIFRNILRLLFSKNDGRQLSPMQVGRLKKDRESNLSDIKPGEDWAQTLREFSGEKMPDWLEVSRDGKFFVKYTDLGSETEKGEIKIIATGPSAERQHLLIRDFEALMDRPPKRAKRVFVSYSHRNTAWLGRLRAHLGGLRRSNEIEAWTDQEILPGDLWDKAIKDKMAEADVFILLLSADFIESNYIWDVELKMAIERFKLESKMVIPVLVEPLDLGGLPGVDEEGLKIQDFEITPKEDSSGRLKAISLWTSHEEALAKVAQKIREAVMRKGGQ
ncbi:MAG: TIR domain-containing protein, partial [Bacteroidetes bacterium]|nr:TIR domain-containing protein [Bacteroidota bacterium]